MTLDETLTPRPRSVYLLAHALEPLRRDAVAAVIRAATVHAGLPAFNVSSFRADESGQDALNAARTLPMMAALRLVEITHLEEAPDSFFVALLEYLERPSDTTCLVITGAGFPKIAKGGKRWSQLVDKALSPSWSWSLDRKATLDARRFVESIAASEGKKIAPDAVRTLVQTFDGKPGVLEQEVRKLALFAQGDAITAADVVTVTLAVGEAAIWDLTGAVVARDAKTALAVLQRLQNQGYDSRQVLGSVSWKLRSVAIAADALRAGASESEASRLSTAKPFEVKRIRAALGTMPSTASLIGDLATANLHMNSHRAGDSRILERLILSWVAG